MKQLFKIPILLLLFFTGPITHAQRDTGFALLKTVHTDVAALSVDYLDNLYILTSTDALKKFNSHGDSVGVYNQVRRFGKLHTIDVTNPLKLLLYYKDFGTIAIVDRLLTLRAAIDLRKYNIIQASAVALSYDGNIWVFDAYENKLKKINDAGEMLLQTSDFRSLFNEPIVPEQIIDQNGVLHLYDPKGGVYLFDYYGTFKKKLPITGWASISVANQYITGIQANTFQFFNTATFMGGQKTLPAVLQTGKKYFVANNKLFTWSKDLVQIYNYPF